MAAGLNSRPAGRGSYTVPTAHHRDFKEKATSQLAECVASMASAHGGLIFVGITDSGHEIAEVKTATMSHVADMLATHLDPTDWLPEMLFEVVAGCP